MGSDVSLCLSTGLESVIRPWYGLLLLHGSYKFFGVAVLFICFGFLWGVNRASETTGFNEFSGFRILRA